MQCTCVLEYSGLKSEVVIHRVVVHKRDYCTTMTNEGFGI